MRPVNDNHDSRFIPFSGSEQDPNERVGYYPTGKMTVELNGKRSLDDFFECSTEDCRSVAEYFGEIVEEYILSSAETNFQGEITFRVRVGPPIMNPGMKCWISNPQ